MSSRLSRNDWAARMLSGSFVEAHIADTVDDPHVLTALPPAGGAASFDSALPDALGLDMCSVDSTTTCPSTTWCQSTTACPSTTDCRSVQTCVDRDAVVAADRAGSPLKNRRLWPVGVSAVS